MPGILDGFSGHSPGINEHHTRMAETAHRRSPFYVGSWFVEPEANRITGNGRSVRVEPKVMQVLQCLAARPGETLTRNELLESAWAETFIEENALSRAVSLLRKVFDDDPRNPAVIVTIPKTGYRLIAPVAREHRGDSAPSLPGNGTPGDGPPGDSAPPHPDDSAPGSPSLAPLTPPRRPFYGYVILAVVALIAVGWLVKAGRTPPVPRTPAPFTSLVGTERQPAFSPDGKQIAFVWTDENDRTDLYTKLIGADTPLRLTDHPGSEWSPTWSPDGTRIAFIRYERDGCGLFTVNALGGPPRKLADCEGRFFMEFSWSPDGHTMALSWQPAPGSPYQVVLLSLDTMARRTLTTPPDRYLGDVDPTFSPDGRTVAFARTRTESMADLYTVSVDGGAPRRLTADDHYLAGFDWTPDGQALTMSSNRSGRFKLWNVPAAGGEPAWLPEMDTYDPGNPTYSRDGLHLAYVEWFFDYNIWRLDRTGAAPVARRVIASTRWDQYPRLSPDGRRAAFVSNRSGSNEIWLSEVDGAHPVRLTTLGDAHVGAPCWSPDGQRIVFELRRGVRSDLYLLPTDGGRPQKLTTDPADDVHPSWSHDGRSVYFASNRTGDWQIWNIPVDGGAARQVTRGGGNMAFEAPDGQSVYFTRPLQDGLWQQPTTGGDAVQRLTVPAAGDWGNWVVQAEGIYFVHRGRPDRLAFFDFATETAAPIFTPERNIPSGQVSLAVSAGQLLYTQLDQRDTDLMLVSRPH